MIYTLGRCFLSSIACVTYLPDGLALADTHRPTDCRCQVWIANADLFPMFDYTMRLPYNYPFESLDERWEVIFFCNFFALPIRPFAQWLASSLRRCAVFCRVNYTECIRSVTLND